ncbi:MAG: RHS repeat-associated core domain-containing protein, partial [bacterium]|nr:RHS repeat-associated core domain-containing protein [bacterium]
PHQQKSKQKEDPMPSGNKTVFGILLSLALGLPFVQAAAPVTAAKPKEKPATVQPKPATPLFPLLFEIFDPVTKPPECAPDEKVCFIEYALEDETLETDFELFHPFQVEKHKLLLTLPASLAIPDGFGWVQVGKKTSVLGWFPVFNAYLIADIEAKQGAGFYRLDFGKKILTPTTIEKELDILAKAVSSDEEIQVQADLIAEQNREKGEYRAFLPREEKLEPAEKISEKKGQESKVKKPAPKPATPKPPALPKAPTPKPAPQKADDKKPVQVTPKVMPPQGPVQGTPAAITASANSDKESAKNNSSKIITIDYDYDALGRLVQRRQVDTDAKTPLETRWEYFGNTRTVEYNRGGPYQRVEYFSGSRGVDYIIPATGEANPPGHRGYALHHDRLGSVTLVTNEKTGEVEERNYFSPFGETTIRKGGEDILGSQIGNSVLFTKQFYDAVAGLYLFTFRAYDPELGKFLQRDPLGTVNGPNMTAYVNNAPFTFVDPLGLSSQIPEYFRENSGAMLADAYQARDVFQQVVDNGGILDPAYGNEQAFSYYVPRTIEALDTVISFLEGNAGAIPYEVTTTFGESAIGMASSVTKSIDISTAALEKGSTKDVLILLAHEVSHMNDFNRWNNGSENEDFGHSGITSAATETTSYAVGTLIKMALNDTLTRKPDGDLTLGSHMRLRLEAFDPSIQDMIYLFLKSVKETEKLQELYPNAHDLVKSDPELLHKIPDYIVQKKGDLFFKDENPAAAAGKK